MSIDVRMQRDTAQVCIKALQEYLPFCLEEREEKRARAAIARLSEELEWYRNRDKNRKRAKARKIKPLDSGHCQGVAGARAPGGVTGECTSKGKAAVGDTPTPR